MLFSQHFQRGKSFVDLFQTFHIWLPSHCTFGAKDKHNQNMSSKTQQSSNLLQIDATKEFDKTWLTTKIVELWVADV
jgi:hypothetical protein